MSALVLAAQDPRVHLTSQTRILAAVLAVAFMAMILDLIRRDRLQERYSVVWFVAGVGMLLGAAFPGLLEVVADAMGVRDTNVALFSIVLLLLLGLALNFSVIMSRQAAQITRLAQERALERAREQSGSGEEVAFNRDRLETLRSQAAGLDSAAARRAAEQVQDTRRRFELNVSEELALEALFFRLQRVLA